MPAPSQAGSRAGLITALVIFVILFLVSGIAFVTKNNDLNATQKRMDDTVAKYKGIISDERLGSPEYAEVDKLITQPGQYNGLTQWDVLHSQLKDATKIVTGQSGSTVAQAMQAQQAAVAQANATLKKAGVAEQVPDSPVTAAIAVLAQAVVDRQQQKTALDAQLVAAKAETEKAREEAAAQMKKFNENVAAEQAKVTTATTAGDTYRQGKDEQVKQLETQMQSMVEAAKKKEEELNGQILAANQATEKLKKDLQKAIQAITKYRPTDVTANMIRRVDGRIIRVDKNNVVYVDLGQGQQVTPGMTFQIYAKLEGIPRTGGGAADDELPPGKGALEIVRVGPTSSEARILKLNAGERIEEGDLLANAVYDRNTKFRFYVYGNFDLDRDKRTLPAEAEMIKRLIVQFGGQLTDHIGPDTDFVVMGQEPVVPNFTKEEIESNQVAKFERDKALEELKKYEDVRDRAVTLYIPVLNQNRFLYMVGYYDQAPKQMP